MKSALVLAAAAIAIAVGATAYEVWTPSTPCTPSTLSTSSKPSTPSTPLSPSTPSATPSLIVFAANRAPTLMGEIYRLDPNGHRVDLSKSPYQDTSPAVSS